MTKKLSLMFFLIAFLFGFVAVAPSYADSDNKSNGKSTAAVRAEIRAESKELREKTREFRDELKKIRGGFQDDDEEEDDNDDDEDRQSDKSFNKNHWRHWFASTTATTSPRFGWFHDGDCKHDDDDKKVEVCHITANGAGHNIVISKNALNAHLAHGDYIGKCRLDGNLPSPDLTAPVISNVSVALSNATATVSWLTNENSDSRMWYSTTSPVQIGGSSTFFLSNAARVQNHSFVLANLLSNTTYYFLISSADASGNRSTSTQSSFVVGDVAAPVISNVSVIHSTSSNATTTNISWLTDEIADSKLWFGTTTPLDLLAPTTVSMATSTVVTSHQFILTNLTPGVPYYYVISSADILGHRSTTTEGVFISP